jgi:hypothetical protein
MKSLYKNSLAIPAESGRFLYVQRTTEINSDLVESLKKGAKEKDERDRIREARKLAIDSLGVFNSKVVGEINASDKLEGDPVEELTENVKGLVLDVLSGGSTSPTRIPPTTAYDYMQLIADLDHGTEEAILTTENVDFAQQTLKELRTNYERHARAVAASLSDEKTRNYWKFWTEEYRDSEKHIFNTRNDFVLKVLSGLEGELAEKQKTANTERDTWVKKIKSDYKELLNPEEQSQLQEVVSLELEGKDELYSGSPLSLDLAQALFGPKDNMPLAKRIEIYKALGWDTRSIDQAMEKAATEDFEKSRQKGIDRRKWLDSKAGGLDTEGFKKALSVPDSTEIPENSDLEGLLEEIRPFMQRDGDRNLHPAFTSFPKGVGPNPYQEFVGYAHFILKKRSEVDSWLNRDLKIKILGYLKYVEAQEVGDETEEILSTEFLDFEKSVVRSRFEAANTLINHQSNGLVNIKNLNQLDTNPSSGHLAKIDAYLVEHVDFEDKAQKLEAKLHSQTEKNLLADYRKDLDRIRDQLERLKKEWEKTLESYKEQKEKYDGIAARLKSFKDSSGSVRGVNGKKYKIPDDGTTETEIKDKKGNVTGHHQSDPYKRNQGNIDNFYVLIDSLRDSKPKSKDKIEVSTISATDIKTLELDIQKVEDDIDEHNKSDSSKTKKSYFANYIRAQSAKEENEQLEKELESNRAKQFELLKAKNIGSSVNIGFQETLFGNTPTSYDTLGQFREKVPILNLAGFSIFQSSDAGVILTGKYKENDKLVFIQKDKEGNIQVIGIPAPKDLLTDGVPADFDPGQHYDFVGSPVSILPV